MAITTIPGGGFYYPLGFFGTIAPATISKINFSVASARAAFIFPAPKSGNIASVVWRTATVTTGGNLEMRLETVDTITGDPTGTLVSANANITPVAILATDDNLIFTTTVTTPGTVTQGQLIAIVFVNDAVPTNMQFAGINHTSFIQYPYHDTFAPSTWTSAITNQGCFALVYDDGTYALPVSTIVPPTLVNSNSFNSGSTPDVRGLRFQFPYSVRVNGAWFAGNLTGNAKCMLVTTAYNQGAGTGILASATLLSTQRGSGAAGIHYITFDATVTLTALTNYRLVIEPSSITNLIVYDTTVASLNLLGLYAGGADFHLTTAKDPTVDADWTNYNSGTFRYPYMGLQINGIDLSGGVASGGSYAFPG